MSVIRSAGLRGFREVVTRLGGDPESLVRRAGIPVAALDADDLLISDVALATALEDAAYRLDRPDLGLLIAPHQDLGMLGALALAIQNSAMVGDAMECVSRYLFVHARRITLTLEPDPYGTPGVGALRLDTGATPPVQGTDLCLGFLHRAIAALVGENYGLRGVELPYRPAAPVERYEQFFGAPVRTGRFAAILRVPTSLAERRLAHGDAHLRRLALVYLGEQARDDVVDRVRTAVRQSLGTALPDIDATARLLAVHRRTLQRRLAEQGTTFAALLDEERAHMARRYLTTTDLPLSQVAALLSLSEQSALTRCARRWWGMTPSAVRRGAAIGGGAGVG